MSCNLIFEKAQDFSKWKFYFSGVILGSHPLGLERKKKNFQWMDNLSVCQMPCHGSGSRSLASHRGCPALFPVQSMWDLWLTKCHWERFFSEYFGFSLSFSFHRWSITRRNEKNLIIFITGLHNKPPVCGASVASAAGPFTTKTCIPFSCFYVRNTGWDFVRVTLYQVRNKIVWIPMNTQNEGRQVIQKNAKTISWHVVFRTWEWDGGNGPETL
jgi:hypothetical protein